MKAIKTVILFLLLGSISPSAWSGTIIIIDDYNLHFPKITGQEGPMGIRLTWGQAEHEIKGVSVARSLTGIVTKHGIVLAITYGEYGEGNGDCLAFVTIDPGMAKVTSIVDWRPRDVSMALFDKTPAENSATFKFRTGEKHDVETAFTVTFDINGNPTWQCSISRWKGGCNEVSKTIERGKWVPTYGGESKGYREVGVYAIFLRNSVDDPRSNDPVKRAHPEGRNATLPLNRLFD
jgi:hypothetical protein